MQTKITILNKLNKNDSITKLDVWYKNYLDNIDYQKKSLADVNGTTVSMGESTFFLIPFDDKYKPYLEWKELEDKENYYTISPGDIIVLGQWIEEEPTPNTISQIRTKYHSQICDVRSVLEVEQKLICKYRLRVDCV